MGAFRETPRSFFRARGCDFLLSPGVSPDEPFPSAAGGRFSKKVGASILARRSVLLLSPGVSPSEAFPLTPRCRFRSTEVRDARDDGSAPLAERTTPREEPGEPRS